MLIKPIKDNVLVRQDPKQDKVGSLFVPQGSERYPDEGTVVLVGPDVKSELREGDRVVFKRQPGAALAPDSREGDSVYAGLLMLKEENILAVVESDE